MPHALQRYPVSSILVVMLLDLGYFYSSLCCANPLHVLGIGQDKPTKYRPQRQFLAPCCCSLIPIRFGGLDCHPRPGFAGSQ